MIRIDIDDRAIGTALQKLQDRLTDLTPALDEIGHTLEQRIRTRFETQTDPDGGRWKEWAPATARVRTQRGGNLLHDTGHMLGGLSYQVDKNAVRIGFAADYAAYHEFGAPRAGLARRGLLTSDPNAGTLSRDDQHTVLEIIQRHLTP